MSSQQLHSQSSNTCCLCHDFSSCAAFTFYHNAASCNASSTSRSRCFEYSKHTETHIGESYNNTHIEESHRITHRRDTGIHGTQELHKKVKGIALKHWTTRTTEQHRNHTRTRQRNTLEHWTTRTTQKHRNHRGTHANETHWNTGPQEPQRIKETKRNTHTHNNHTGTTHQPSQRNNTGTLNKRNHKGAQETHRITHTWELRNHTGSPTHRNHAGTTLERRDQIVAHSQEPSRKTGFKEQ